MQRVPDVYLGVRASAVGRAGRLAQLVEHRLYTPAVTGSSPVPPTSLRALHSPRASARQASCRTQEKKCRTWGSDRRHPWRTCIRPSAIKGVVVQLVRTPACHAGGREFEPRRPRHFFPTWKTPGDGRFAFVRVSQSDSHEAVKRAA